MMPPQILRVDYQRGAKYVVAKKLHGGMGSVLKLFPVAGGSPIVAMKTIRGDASIKAFDIECEAWFSIAHHPNIARPLAFGTWNSLPSVLIEWYPLSLDDLDLKKLSGQQIQTLIAETVGALRYASDEKRLIHQDIKPANILIDKSGRVKLSDFGLARCLVQTAKERVQLGIGDVPKSTSRDLSGTPFFLAPELWDGATPSVRTDIFSLGVTFYHAFTKEHPYFENTATRALPRNKLPLDPLVASVSAKGNEGFQIVRFIEKCLALDPKRRYQTYQEIFSEMAWTRFSHGVHDWSVERSEIVAAAAQFFCTKGDIQKAFGLLEKGLNERPTDVVLLEAFGKLHSAVGQVKEAELPFEIVYNSLKPSRGLYKGRFLPRPALAWARSRIRSGYFQEAADIVKEVLAWGRTHSDRSQPIELVGLGQYSEIGWYLLYQGEFSRAVHELTTYASRYSLDKLESIWAVEAAWLSGAIKAQADEITIKVLDNTPNVCQSPGKVEFVWARMVLQEYVNPLLSEKLWNSNPSYLFREIDNLETPSGVSDNRALLLPKELDNQKPFIVAMDTYSTGGLHHGLIRSLSKL